MKLISEIHEWCQGSFDRYGDAGQAVGQVFARFVAQPPPAHTEILAGYDSGSIALALDVGQWIPLPVSTDGPRANEETGALEAFGIEEISAGFWTLSPSLNIPGVIHVFVHIYNTPIVPPWKSLI